MNGDEAEAWAVAFAGRVLRLAGADRRRQVEVAYSLAYSREPDAWERDTALTFFARQAALVAEPSAGGEEPPIPEPLPPGVAPGHAAALVDYSLMLLNSNEFLYRF